VPGDHNPVKEYPLALTVNGVELATLIASPHDLHYLVAGFLRMQGLIRAPGDLLTLSVCQEFGAASARIRGEAPTGLSPTLTSGCGAGVSFHVPGAAGKPVQIPSAGPLCPPDALFSAMAALARAAESYRSSGGIHSAAVSDGERLLLFAEDIGRHNTLDRIAGEALLRGIDLSGRILAASGRVSSEMAAKAASLGISVIASRTSPTDLAARICEELGITLVGYVRGRRFNVYAHPERIAVRKEAGRIPGVTGVILAGGKSRRMGSDKALLPYQGGRFIEAIHRRMAELFEEVIVVTGAPGRYDFLPCRRVPDLFEGMGALAGIHSGLRHSGTDLVFVAACDMPGLNGDVVRHLCGLAEGADAVVPEGEKGPEPLHAVYRKSALPAIEKALRDGERRVVSFFDRVTVRRVGLSEMSRLDPSFEGFRNINTPEDYYRLRDVGWDAAVAAGPKAVAFVAPSGTGKTTLMVRVIAVLARRGRRVGALKHGPEGFEFDRPGKDTHRFSAAGADTTVIASSDKVAMVRRLRGAVPVEELLARHFPEADIVLVEGFKESALPKIEVHRGGVSAGLVCRGAVNDPALVAVASDAPLDVDVPVLPLGDPSAVADFLERRFLGTGAGP
jgi:FdhD protein